MELQNLIIEVTRKCNIKCEHCLRGNAQKMVIDTKYIDSLLDQVEYIGNICFTGGEPSLATHIIEYTLSELKRLNIRIGFFFIATNGVNVPEEFVIACLKLYAYCEEKDMCQVAISNDSYHAREASYSTELLDGLRFCNRRNAEEGYTYMNGRNLINEGRAVDFGSLHNLTSARITSREEFEEAQIYLNCKGYIINGCDWSYNSQNRKENIVCHVDKLSEFYNTLVD